MPFLYSELYYVLLFISGVTNAATKHNCLITEYKPHADKLHVKRCLIPNKVVVFKTAQKTTCQPNNFIYDVYTY